MVVLGIAFFTDIVAINMFSPAIGELVVIGWMVFGVGALFYVMSVLTLRRKGVDKIIDTGIYGIVRHPMYLGAMMMFFSHALLGQNLIAAIGSAVAVVCCYMIILSGDQRNIEKFGNDYKHYMQRVPRMDFLLGALRQLGRRKKQRT